MAGPQVPALVRAALRCYPVRWRQRHGDEAAEVARRGRPRPARLTGEVPRGRSC